MLGAAEVQIRIDVDKGIRMMLFGGIYLRAQHKQTVDDPRVPGFELFLEHPANEVADDQGTESEHDSGFQFAL